MPTMDTTNTYIMKGKVSAVMSKTRATVVPMFSDSPVSIELVIPWYLWECLEVDMEVIYSQFPDNTGIILGRMDGEWNHKIWDGVQIMTGNVCYCTMGAEIVCCSPWAGGTSPGPHYRIFS